MVFRYSKEELTGRHLISTGCHVPYNPDLKQRARELRNNQTSAEKKLWEEVLCLDSFRGYRFLRQKPIDNYIVDFYCAKLKLVIEIDGDSHASTRDFDEERTKTFERYELRVIRFANDTVLNDIERVYQVLLNALK